MHLTSVIFKYFAPLPGKDLSAYPKMNTSRAPRTQNLAIDYMLEIY